MIKSTGHHYRISELRVDAKGKKQVQQYDNCDNQQTLEHLQNYLNEGLQYVKDPHGYIVFNEGFYLRKETDSSIATVRFEFIGEWEEVPST